MRITRTSAFLLASVVSSVTAAKEKAAAPAPAESAIETAKRDYDVIKAGQAPQEQQKLALPREDIPTLNMPSNDSPAMPLETLLQRHEREAKKAGKQKKSANWLVDAMAANKSGDTKTGNGKIHDTRASALEDEDELEAGDSLLADRLAADQKSAMAKRGEKDASAEKRPPADTPNPLANYMATWMTPRDFELLKVTPAATAGAANGDKFAAPPGGEASASGLPDFRPWGNDSASLAAPGSPPAGTAAAPNPYLSDLLSPAPPVNMNAGESPVSVSIFGNSSASGPGPTRLIEPTPPAKSAPIPSEFLKAQDDAKYFKQLKRF